MTHSSCRYHIDEIERKTKMSNSTQCSFNSCPGTACQCGCRSANAETATTTCRCASPCKCGPSCKCKAA